MRHFYFISMLMIFGFTAFGQECVDCHREVTPGIVADWESSMHAQTRIGCAYCHRRDHTTADDVAEARIPTPETCGMCHRERLEQYSAGKHALAWSSMKAMPTFHRQALGLTEASTTGCGGCHKIGLKTADEILELKEQGEGFGVASCDACHTRHTFSRAEAQQPQACQTCHMGSDHPQWEMYSTSKHGVRYLLKQNGVLPETASAPTCQTCHMQEGNHEVRTAWGSLAVRFPMPANDEQWAADRVTLLNALGVLDPEGNPTARLDLVKQAQLVRLTQEEFDLERNKMVETCGECHAESFARAELEKGDQMIREADRLMAQAIEVVGGLYADGIIDIPEDFEYIYPDLLAFYNASTPIEFELHEMYMEYRMRTFKGAFHDNPDYAIGWATMARSLTEIRQMAEQMRAEADR